MKDDTLTTAGRHEIKERHLVAVTTPGGGTKEYVGRPTSATTLTLRDVRWHDRLRFRLRHGWRRAVESFWTARFAVEDAAGWVWGKVKR